MPYDLEALTADFETRSTRGLEELAGVTILVHAEYDRRDAGVVEHVIRTTARQVLEARSLHAVR